MFREPEAVALKPVTKLDPSASARSSIRRQRSVRYPPHLNRDRHLSSRPRSHRHNETSAEFNRLHLHEGVRMGATNPHAERAYSIERSANQAHAEASRRRRHESGRAILRDALSYERAQGSMDLRREHSYALSMMRPPTPPTSSSWNPSRLQRHMPLNSHARRERRSSRHWPALSQTPPPAYIPSPPYTSGEPSDQSSPDGLQSDQGTVSLTPRFAPAHPLRTWGSAAGQASPQLDPPAPDDITTGESLDELPPLHRVSQRHTVTRSYRGFPTHGVVDGLGDRWRSISPDDAFWENLVSTMPPDARLPSTSASTSFRSDEGASHYNNTVAPARELTESIDSYPHVCEISDSDSDFSETDEDAVRTLQRLGGESFPHASGDSVEDAVAMEQRRRHILNALPSLATSQRPATSNNGVMHLNDFNRPQRLGTDEWLQHNQQRELGRPSRERL
ncbi:MAG: hypothetical protein Q9218_000214 [Villophora microphyllina]